ncbi:MAG TPA: S8 family serine peptidase [Candidatus Saccharimonadales bacterium]|nr:S8 family serine peptidase [Candidatus Saccharimonadales bacterium]
MKIKIAIITLVVGIAGGFFTAGQFVRPENPTPPLSPASETPKKPLPIMNALDQRSLQTIRSDRMQPPVATIPHPATNVSLEQAASFHADGVEYPLRTYETMAVNDPAANQWWISSTGLNTAWNIGAGARHTTVAVIDTGFALAHEEFAGRWAQNSSEKGAAANQNPSRLNCTDRGLAIDKSCNLIDDDYDGIVDNETGSTANQNPSQRNCTDRGIPLDKSCNLIDDDNNGYIDDVTGWDFADNDSSVQAGEMNPSGAGTQHGTMVAGILGATGNNGKGIAGVNWTTDILPLQAIDDNRYGNTLTVARAIYYAADRGVDVISLSLGASSEDPYLRQAIRYAMDHGAIVVAASGNDGCNCISYPANYPEVVAVGAENASGQPSSFSSYGANLDILAPGENMASASWAPNNGTSLYASGIAGTSFATPYVSGLLALSRSHQPDASWGELQSTLQMTASHTGLTSSAPFSPTRGSGTVRADMLISRTVTPAHPSIRYTFAPLTTSSILGTNRAYDCTQEGAFPATPLYKLISGGVATYTTDTLTMVDAAAGGATVSTASHVCEGLPGDTASTERTIDLRHETDSYVGKQ